MPSSFLLGSPSVTTNSNALCRGAQWYKPYGEIRAATARVVDWIDQLDPDTTYLSVITVGEIRKGIEKLSSSKRREKLHEWLNDELLIRFQGRIVEITTEIMLTWGELAGRLEKAGKQMAAIDSMIAASALQGKYTLVTRNTHDFQHADVAMINPWN